MNTTTDTSSRTKQPCLTADQVRTLIETGTVMGRRWLWMQLIVKLLFHHGLRPSEIQQLRWSDVSFEPLYLHVRRSDGSNIVLPLTQLDEIPLRYHKQRCSSSFIFGEEDSKPIPKRILASIVKLVGIEAGLPFPVRLDMAPRRAATDLEADTQLRRQIVDRRRSSGAQVH